MDARVTRQCRVLAQFVLQAYRLTKDERADEADRLREALLAVIETCTENLEHRKVTR